MYREPCTLFTAEYGDIVDPSVLSRANQCVLASNYAHFQMDTKNNASALILSGFPDMRVGKLLEHVDRLNTCSVFCSLNELDERRKDEALFLQKSKEEIKKEGYEEVGCFAKVESNCNPQRFVLFEYLLE